MADVRMTGEMTSSLGVDWKFEFFEESYTGSSTTVPIVGAILSYHKQRDPIMEPIKTSEITVTILDDGTAGVSTALASLLNSSEDNNKILAYKDTGSGYEFQWAGVVLKDSAIIYNSAPPTEYTIRAVCGLTRLRDIYFDEAIDGSYGSPQTLLKFVLDCLEYNDLSQFWGASDPYFTESIEWISNEVTTPTSSDSPLLYTRCDAGQFIDKTDVQDAEARTCFDVIEAIMQIMGARIMLSGGSYVIQQMRNFENSTHQIRPISKTLVVGTPSSPSNRVSVVTTQPTSGEVRVNEGGEFSRLPALYDVRARIKGQATISFGVQTKEDLTPANNPVTHTYDLGTIRGGPASGKAFGLRLLAHFQHDQKAALWSGRLKIEITITLPTTGSTYYLGTSSTSAHELEWQTSSTSITIYMEEIDMVEHGKFREAFFTTPEIPAAVHTGCELEIIYTAIDHTGSPISGAGWADYNIDIYGADVYLLNDKQIINDSVLAVANPTSTNNSKSMDLGFIWLHDLGIISSKNTFEIEESTGVWVESETWDADFIDTNLLHTIMLETMSMQRLPVKRYKGLIDGFYVPHHAWSYDSENYILIGGDYHLRMDEFDGEWVHPSANRTNVVNGVLKDVHPHSRGPQTTTKTGGWIGGGGKAREQMYRDELARVGTYIAGGSTTTTIDVLDPTIGHTNVKDDDRIYIIHPQTLLTIDSFVVNGDHAASATAITVDSKVHAEELPAGSIIQHQVKSTRSGDTMRADEFRIRTGGGITDASAANSSLYYSSTAGGLVYKEAGGGVSPLTGSYLDDNSVTFAKLGAEYTENNASLGTAVDWSAYATFQKTLSGNTTLTDSNLRLGTKVLLIDGNYTLTFPTYWKVIDGAYDGSSSQKNAITVTCLDATGSSEVVIVSIVTYT